MNSKQRRRMNRAMTVDGRLKSWLRKNPQINPFGFRSWTRHLKNPRFNQPAEVLPPSSLPGIIA